ncbi:MAG: hypothetical protein ACON42_04795 [Flavobacteriaceae bacterium]
MQLLHRIGYYLLGLSIGIVFVAFFFSGKKTSCNYGPEARVLADFAKKTYVVDSSQRIGSNVVSPKVFESLLNQASIDFSASETQLDSCKRYRMLSLYKQTQLSLQVENCRTKIRILEIRQQP